MQQGGAGISIKSKAESEKQSREKFRVLEVANK